VGSKRLQLLKIGKLPNRIEQAQIIFHRGERRLSGGFHGARETIFSFFSAVIYV
jgi:hypothetical protein